MYLISTITSDYTVPTTVSGIIANTASNTITIVLPNPLSIVPNATAAIAISYWIKKISALNTVTITCANPSILLEGASSITLTQDNESVNLQFSGANFYIISSSSTGGGSSYITSVSDTNTVDLDVTASNLTANVKYQNTSTINISDDASGLKADFASMNISQFTNDSGYLTSADLSGYVPTSRTLTINGVTYDLSADRTWTISAGTVTNVSALTIGTSGTDLSSTVANPTTTPVITLNVPTASATNRGALSSTDWSTFNSKEPAITWAQGDIIYGTGVNTYAKLAKSTTTGQFLSNSGMSNNPAWATPLGITFVFGSMLGSFNPADNSTYYFGGQYSTNATNTAGIRRLYIVTPCTITTVYGQFYNSGSGSGESSTLYIRLNNTTDYLISSSILNNSQTTTFNATGLSIPITSSSDYIEFKLVTATWATNPTNISVWGSIYAS